MEKLMALIGERLKSAIKRSPYSQKEIAEKVGISENALTNYIKGKRVPDIIVMEQIAQLCGLTTSDIVLGDYTIVITHEMLIAFQQAVVDLEEKFEASKKKLNAPVRANIILAKLQAMTAKTKEKQQELEAIINKLLYK